MKASTLCTLAVIGTMGMYITTGLTTGVYSTEALAQMGGSTSSSSGGSTSSSSTSSTSSSSTSSSSGGSTSSSGIDWTDCTSYLNQPPGGVYGSITYSYTAGPPSSCSVSVCWKSAPSTSSSSS